MNTCLAIVVFQPPQFPRVLSFREYNMLQYAIMMDPASMPIISDDDPLPTKRRLMEYWISSGKAEKFRQKYTYIPEAIEASA